MHEFSVMAQIVENVLREASARNARRVESVDLQIGDFTMLGEEQLRFAYEILSKDSILAGSELKIGHIKGEIRCPSCGYEGEVPLSEDSPHRMIPILECPKCHNAAEIAKGRECIVRNISMVVPDV
jgi:hydrogenase nickel incorporation protein HypA/HybF